MKTLRSCIQHAYDTLKMILWSKMGIYSKVPDLCIPKSNTRELLIRKVHSGSLASHYGEKKDVINAIRVLLLAKDVKRCPRHSEKMCYLSSAQESFVNTRIMYTVTNSNGAMGRCNYGFYSWITKDATQ